MIRYRAQPIISHDTKPIVFITPSCPSVTVGFDSYTSD